MRPTPTPLAEPGPASSPSCRHTATKPLGKRAENLAIKPSHRPSSEPKLGGSVRARLVFGIVGLRTSPPTYTPANEDSRNQQGFDAWRPLGRARYDVGPFERMYQYFECFFQFSKTRNGLSLRVRKYLSVEDEVRSLGGLLESRGPEEFCRGPRTLPHGVSRFP